MTIKDLPQGQLFSRTYLERTAPVADSPRFRQRLNGYYQQHLTDHRHHLASLIEVELGVKVPFQHGPAFESFFPKAQIRDVLDTISLIVRILESQSQAFKIAPWIEFVQRVFEEESLHIESIQRAASIILSTRNFSEIDYLLLLP
jgi:hypothetical protein